MANTHHLSILNKGVQAWNEWRRLNPDIEVDLSGAILGGRNFEFINFQGVNLKGAYLPNSSLRNANLCEANISGIFLFKSDIREANLRGAFSEDSPERRTDFREVNAEGADLQNIRIPNANFQRANFYSAKIQNAYLPKASFLSATLERANLANTNLKGGRFVQANLRYANLKFANLDGAIFENADLEYASLEGASFRDTRFDSVNLSNTILSGFLVSEKQVSLLDEKDFDISILSPKRLAKGHTSQIEVHIHLSILLAQHQELGRPEETVNVQSINRTSGRTKLPVHKQVKIELKSSAISFSEPIFKLLRPEEINKVSFDASPKDEFGSGIQSAICSITNPETGDEYISMSFSVVVDDYAFGRIPRPAITFMGSAVAGLGSFMIFTVTMLSQVDNALGATAGFTAGTVAALLVISSTRSYTQKNHNSPAKNP